MKINKVVLILFLMTIGIVFISAQNKTTPTILHKKPPKRITLDYVDLRERISSYCDVDEIIEHEILKYINREQFLHDFGEQYNRCYIQFKKEIPTSSPYITKKIDLRLKRHFEGLALFAFKEFLKQEEIKRNAFRRDSMVKDSLLIISRLDSLIQFKEQLSKFESKNRVLSNRIEDGKFLISTLLVAFVLIICIIYNKYRKLLNFSQTKEA